MSTTETLGSDEQKLAELGYKQELRTGMERVLELRDLVLDHLHPGRLLHHLRAGAQERWPDRDLDRLAADLRADPVCRLVDVRARVRVPDGGRHLLLGVQAGWRRMGLVHRLVQPHRPGRGGGLGGVRLSDLPDEPARPLRSPLHLQLRQGRSRDERSLQRARQLRPVRVHPRRRRADQRLPQPPRVGPVQLLGVVERARRGRDRGDPDRGALPPRELLLRVRPQGQRIGIRRRRGWRGQILVLRASARLPSDDVHDHRLRRLRTHIRGDPRR